MTNGKSDAQNNLYRAVIAAAFRTRCNVPFTFNDLVSRIGYHGCTTAEVQEVGRRFAAFVRRAPNHPFHVYRAGTPLIYMKLQP